MIAVFKTNITTEQEALRILNLLGQLFPQAQANFDLEDCDNILRVVLNTCTPEEVNLALSRSGYQCEELPD